MGVGNGRGMLLGVTWHLLLPLLAHCSCPLSFPCRNFTLEFPFTDIKDPRCGLLPVDGCDSQCEHPTVHIGSGVFLRNLSILNKTSENSMLMAELGLQEIEKEHRCGHVLTNPFEMGSSSVSFAFSPYNPITFSKCLNTVDVGKALSFKGYEDYTECESLHFYYERDDPAGIWNHSDDVPDGCHKVQLPKLDAHHPGDLFVLLSPRFTLEWDVSEACSKCLHGGGMCLSDSLNQFYCGQDKSRLKLILVLSISGAGLLLLLSITYIIWLRKKISIKGSYLLTRNISLHPTLKSDIEGGVIYFGIPVFSYTELEEATHNFDPSRELGDGGFGTVYYGKLRDGREVAIKRLYEHNFKRVEQFLNEIKILTSLRHPNLVSLYGCTSRRSRELLLVYEYSSNGTVADHLHGETAAEAALSWPVRMNIALETAAALVYLHKSDIIHRDVKTNNILLDSNFSVKVADFGLSRLFPDNVTHISTAPQGTPGYVDPEYHQCYQLTDKSDVYSFGVVLIELISSMPAVDVSRHRHEVNLANLAMNRIQRGAFDELIDPSLGYDSDPEVTRMSTMVAELAFRCLQVDKDLRPSMNEVLTFLKDIGGSEDCNVEQINEGHGYHRMIPPSPEPCSATASNTTTSSV